MGALPNCGDVLFFLKLNSVFIFFSVLEAMEREGVKTLLGFYRGQCLIIFSCASFSLYFFAEQETLSLPLASAGSFILLFRLSTGVTISDNKHILLIGSIAYFYQSLS